MREVPRRYRVAARREEFPGTTTLDLQPVEPSPAADFAPGRFAMLGTFAGEVPISLAGVESYPTLRHTVRAVGGASAALAELGEGEELWLRGPFGRGWPVDDLVRGPVVIVAGGLGLAPLRPLLLALEARGVALSLFYGMRRPEEMLYRQEVVGWAARFPVHLSADRADPGWSGTVGVITRPLAQAPIPAEAGVALCGPEVMMRLAARLLVERGLDPGRIYLSMERNMHCATGHCGHCQWGPWFVCRDGPVFRYAEVAPWLDLREV
ncbi:MAG: oxidoreductase [Porticoccaceae bacterium]|nr:MAG: oxidoreductase [Porticoccaceae bacterium]